MMDFEKYYQNVFAHPLKKDFTEIEILVSKTGEKIPHTIFHKEEYNKEIKNRLLEQVRLEQIFKQELFEDLGITNNPKAQLLFAKAYEFGHSEGFESVYNWACDLVDLIR